MKTFDELKTQSQIEKLTQETESTLRMLVSARKRCREARARKNYLEMRLADVEDRLELLKQRQLCLGDNVASSGGAA